MDSKPPAYTRNEEVEYAGAEKTPEHLARVTSPSTTLTTQASTDAAFRTTFASLSLHRNDRIRLLGFSQEDVIGIETVIKQRWAKGIQDKRPYGPSREFKLYGSPWNPSSWFEDEKTAARRLMCGLLESLYNMGWVLKAAVDIIKKDGDKDTLLFRHQQPPPPPCNWLCISFNRADILRLFDAPQDVCQALVLALGRKVQRSYTQGSAFEIKFNGYPWKANGTETVETRAILLTLLNTLEQFGFSLYGSIQQDSKQGEEHVAVDTWFCNRQVNWTPGAPIYHG
ncbi:hypothetical protein FQN53_004999 [Emmonsiellopsis sp. PD_33]|nr:hypothetical protein FQN53_004999 [Emmonsiellopsis sp. PD_33]